MTPKEWYISRNRAYEQFELVRENSTDEAEVKEAWDRYAEIRRILRWWRLSEDEAWQKEWRRLRYDHISETLHRLNDERE